MRRFCAAVLIPACAGCPHTNPPTNTFCPAPLRDDHNADGYACGYIDSRGYIYTTGHDGDLHIPVWTSYRITGEYVDGKEFIPRKRPWWTPDPDLLPDKRATDMDYRTIG